MAVQELNEEQIRTWSLEQKDRWWLENVYRGNMPQLTLRAAATGMGLGAVLSLTNIYIGAKTGWTLGVGITSVILAFALFKALAAMGWADEFTILENNAMQSIATASGYMTSPPDFQPGRLHDGHGHGDSHVAAHVVGNRARHPGRAVRLSL